MVSRTFPAEASSIRAARRYVVEHLGDLPDERRDVVVLVVSELATNAVVHAESSFTVGVSRGRRSVRVEVTDGGRGTPAVRAADLHATSGRGLRIVEDLATAWGIRRRRAGGKTVWVELATA